jgi:exopolyphosphatase/guanosine-5'-triphosphate,3'-diphosphate pyrophosphatase
MIAVIDIGSNTIKLLIARGERRLETVFEQVEECRISRGISEDAPRLSQDSITRGTMAVKRLVDVSKQHGVEEIRVVATSAVRDASNRKAFLDSVLTNTGQQINVIDGEEESRLIAEGLKYDPALQEKGDYFNFDLGGGSLEFNRVQSGELTFFKSMQLGAVRLTEKFLKQPRNPIPREELREIKQHTKDTFQACAIPKCPIGNSLIITGGSASIARAMIHGVPVKDVSTIAHPEVKKAELDGLLTNLRAIPFEQRIHAYPMLPENRADVVCTALQILISILELCEKSKFQHSNYALRHGVAASNWLQS